MAIVRDPVTGQLVDDGQGPIVVPAPVSPPLPPLPGMRPAVAPDDVGPNDLLTGNLLTAQTGAAVQAQNAARAAALAAPTATGGAVVPSLTHGLPVNPMAAPADVAQPAPGGVLPPAVAPVAPQIAAPAPVVPRHAGGGHAAGTPGLPPVTPSDSKDRDALGEGREDLLKDKGSLAARQADIAAGTADSTADLESKYQALGDAERTRFTADFQKRTADRDAAIEAAAKAKPQSYLGTRGLGASIVTTLALASGAIGAGLSAASGHPTGNLALVQLNSQIAEWDKQQHDEIARLNDVAAMKRAGVTDAVQAHKILEGDVQDRKNAALASLVADGERRLKGLGRTQAEIDSNVAINDLKTQLLDGRRTRIREDASDALNRLTVQSNLATAKSTQAKNYAEAGAAGITARAALLKAQNIGNGLAVRDPVTGEPIGVANSPKSQRAMAALLANQRAYEDNLDELTTHVQKYGNLIDPTTPQYKERERLIGETVVKGQQVMGGNSSDERAKLEKQIIGGSGLGISRVASPASLQNLKAESQKIVQYNLNANLTRSPDMIQQGAAQPHPDAQKALTWYKNLKNAKDPDYAAMGAYLKAQGMI